MKNFTNNPVLSIIILLLLTANIVTLTLLWINKGPGKERREIPPPPGGGGPVFEFVSDELKLDSAQREAYRKLRDEHQAGQKPLQDSIRKAKDAFFSLLQQANAPDSLIQAGMKRTSEAEQKLEILTFRHFQKLRALCRPDQQQKFDKIIEDVLHRMAQPRGPGGPPRGQQGPPPTDGKMPPPPEEHGGPRGEQGPPPDGHGSPLPGH